MHMILEQIFGKTNLTHSERQIADFIESNPRVAVNLSLEELSALCYVSQASIIRLCKKLGAKGFSAFKIKLASELSNIATTQNIHVDFPLSPEDNCKSIAEKFYNLSTQTLERTYANLDYAAIKKAAQLLARADTIQIYGRGESLILAEDFHYKLIRIGMNSSLESLNGFQEARCLQTNNKLNQVALLISHYCNSRQVHYIVDELMSSKTPFILITAAENPWPYDKYAAAVLRIASAESRFKIGSFASRTAMLYLLDCLYGQIFSLNYERNRSNLTQFSQRKVERSYYYNVKDKSGPVD